MINRLCILLLFALNLSTFNGYNINSYRNLEEKVRLETEFVENGVKIEFNTGNDSESERKRIEKIIKENFSSEEKENKIDFNVWKEKNRSYANIQIINKNKEIDTNEIKNKLKKFTDENSNEVKYFQYHKGKINKNLQEEYTKNLGKDFEMIEIENGYTGKIKLGKDNVNVGLINYDTGLNLIIGTPIIFTTY